MKHLWRCITTYPGAYIALVLGKNKSFTARLAEPVKLHQECNHAIIIGNIKG